MNVVTFPSARAKMEDLKNKMQEKFEELDEIFEKMNEIEEELEELESVYDDYLASIWDTTPEKVTIEDAAYSTSFILKDGELHRIEFEFE